MSTMNISLPDELKDFEDHRIQAEGYGSSSEYMRELIRRDRDRAQFRQYLLDGIDAKHAVGVGRGNGGARRPGKKAEPAENG